MRITKEQLKSILFEYYHERLEVDCDDYDDFHAKLNADGSIDMWIGVTNEETK
jgi:hypothetical protein